MRQIPQTCENVVLVTSLFGMRALKLQYTQLSTLQMSLKVFFPCSLPPMYLLMYYGCSDKM